VLGKGPGAVRPSWLAGAYILAEARLGSVITIYNDTVVVDGQKIPVYGGAITGLFINMKAPIPPITGKIVITGNGYIMGNAAVTHTTSTSQSQANNPPQPPSQAVAEKAVEQQRATIPQYLVIGGVILVLAALLL